jgi:quinol monooxygenase YgiN
MNQAYLCLWYPLFQAQWNEYRFIDMWQSIAFKQYYMQYKSNESIDVLLKFCNEMKGMN